MFVSTSIVREMFTDSLYGITLYTIVDLRFMTFSAKVFLFRPVPYVQKIYNTLSVGCSLFLSAETPYYERASLGPRPNQIQCSRLLFWMRGRSWNETKKSELHSKDISYSYWHGYSDDGCCCTFEFTTSGCSSSVSLLCCNGNSR